MVTAYSKDAKASSSSLQTSVVIDPARITLGDFEYRAISCSAISPDEQSTLLTQLRDELQKRVSAMPPSPQGRPAILRAAITRVETVSPPLNTIAALLVIVPFDRGGAAVEIEAIDPDTGKQLAALKLGYFAPLSDLKARFSKFAPAEIAVKKAADDFVPLLQPAHAASLSSL